MSASSEAAVREREPAVDEREARRLAREERRETSLKRKADDDAAAADDAPSPRAEKASKTSASDDATATKATPENDPDAPPRRRLQVSLAVVFDATGRDLGGDTAFRTAALMDLLGLSFETSSLACDLGTPSQPMPDSSYVKLSTALLEGRLGKFQTRGQLCSALRGCFLSATQARLLCMAVTSKLTYVMPGKDSEVFGKLNECNDVVHTILARVVDKDNLKPYWGAEGYYAKMTSQRENPAYWRPCL